MSRALIANLEVTPIEIKIATISISLKGLHCNNLGFEEGGSEGSEGCRRKDLLQIEEAPINLF